MTSAIGAGANDVSMIQAADIGVKISGMEGMQMILCFVYKNVAFGMTLFYYDIYTRFSGEDLYDDWYMTFFNAILTSLPVISLGVFEQDVLSDVCLQFPALYQQGQRNIYFSWTRIFGWLTNALFASLVIFILNIHIFHPAAFNCEGEVMDVAHVGAIMYTRVIWTVNCQFAVIISHFTWIQHLFIWGSISLWYIFLVIYGFLPITLSKRGFHLFYEAIGSASIY